jgi:adenine/guanine phosphoribosyltransferase-like PRPP-binding protein
MSVYAEVHDPLVVPLETKQQLSRLSQEGIDAWTAKVKAAGHDGVALTFGDGTIELVAFEPNQVKSAIGNRGAHDPNDPNILRQAAGGTISAVKPPRAAWGDFPDVLIHAAESMIKKHPDYPAAKAGDADSAKRLIDSTINPSVLELLRQQLDGRTPKFVAVHAYESQGVNAIPEALSSVLADHLGLDTEDSIIQTNIVGHTGAGGFVRMANQAEFSGDVVQGGEYVLVDDFVGQGGTLANLKGFIETAGGKVILATTLTGKAHSAKLAPSNEQLEELRNKHGSDIETWWKDRFGHAFDSLTQSEARYLARTESADIIRNRIAEAEQARNLAASSEDGVDQTPQRNAGEIQQTARGSFNPATNTIALVKDADISPVFHESGHFFLDTYSSSIAVDAPPAIRAGMDKLLAWFGNADGGKGISALDRWNGMENRPGRGPTQA